MEGNSLIELYKEDAPRGAKKTRERFIKRYPYLKSRLEKANCYLLHEEKLTPIFTTAVLNLAKSNDNWFCVISSGLSAATGYPTITGDGTNNRVILAVAEDSANLGELAIYRLDTPIALSRAAALFDEGDPNNEARDTFLNWKEPLISPVESRGREYRKETKGTGKPTGKREPRIKKLRPTIIDLDEENK